MDKENNKKIITKEEQVTIVNLTPHTINILNQTREEIANYKSEGVARCTQEISVEGQLNNIPIIKTVLGEVEGLPDEDEEGNTFYIVSRLIQQAFKDRTDLLAPGELVRDAEGRVIGCKSLSIN